MADSNHQQQQCMHRSPFSYRNDRLRQLERSSSSLLKSSTSNPFIAGVDASDLWLSPPQASDSEVSRATSLPAGVKDTADFSLLGGDSFPDLLLPSYSYSTPPSPGRAAAAAASSSASSAQQPSSSSALFPSLDSWLHSNLASATPADQLVLPRSPPSSAGGLSSPSSSSASSSSPQLHPNQQELPQETSSKRKRRKPSFSSMATNNNPSIITTEGGAFNVNSKSTMKDACSYDLRDHQEPPTVQKEYGGASSDSKDMQGLSAKVENTQGPVCFPKTASTPVPSSPSRFANPQDVKPHIGADPASSSLAASTNGSADMGKPLSSSSGGSNGNNLALDPSLDLSRPAPRAGQPSFLKNTGDGIIRTPGPGQMVSPKEAFLDYEDILKRGRQPQMQGSPHQQNQQQFQRQPQQQGSPMQQSQQFKLPSQSRGGDIQVPQMNLPQMPPPQQPQQNSFQAQPEQPPPPGQSYDGPDAQLLAALGGQRAMSHQGSPPNRGQQLPNTQQHQQQQRGVHQMGNQGLPQQRQLQTQPAPQPMTQQQQNAARQAAYQGFMAQPPPPPPIGQNTSTDIQVPQSNAPTSNVGTPSAGQSSLPPLPNYQSAPAPLAFNDGSFFSHQAILASLQAEENAKAAAAAAAVMGFQNGNWNVGNGPQPGQQQQNGTQGQYNFAQQGQQQGQQGLPGFGAPAPAGASVLGDFSFEQHFGAPPPAGTSPDASTSSRKRIKGKSGSRGTLSRSNSTTSNSGGGRNKAMAAEARALQGQYGGAFNFGTFAGNNNNGIGSGAGGNGGNNEVDAEGEDEEDSKPQYNSRGMPKRKSASAARELAQAQQQDHNEEYEYQGFIPKGSGTAGGVMPTTGVPPSANLGPGGSGAAGDNDSDDSDDDDGDEWVAEESDDSYGRKKKGTNKRGRKSGGKASLTPAEAEALRAASPTTAAAALAAAAAGNGSFDFSNLLGDYSVGSPDSASGTPGPSGKKRKHNAAPPGSGNISCDYVDPKTGERCPVKFRRPYDQARHMETVHSGTAEKAKWACITCKKSFSRKDALIRHGRISNHATM